ncbi:hypothetical protein Bpfe_020545, partial [Biomphalaria pfeifferi]
VAASVIIFPKQNYSSDNSIRSVKKKQHIPLGDPWSCEKRDTLTNKDADHVSR